MTQKQIAASRANGQKSHGPTTNAGKAKSRFNALKHGIHAESQIMFDETAEDLAELAAELHEQYNPADATERFFVDTLVNNEWRLRRLRTVEADLWQTGVNTYLEKHPEFERATSGDALATIGPAFERLQRIVNSCERNYHRALKELVAAQMARAHASSASQPEGATTTSESSGSFRANPETPANAAHETAPEAAENNAQPARASQEEVAPEFVEEMAAADASFQANSSQF
jgi:hypothetical protein